jgi:hypothetical protein
VREGSASLVIWNSIRVLQFGGETREILECDDQAFTDNGGGLLDRVELNTVVFRIEETLNCEYRIECGESIS